MAKHDKKMNSGCGLVLPGADLCPLEFLAAGCCAQGFPLQPAQLQVSVCFPFFGDQQQEEEEEQQEEEEEEQLHCPGKESFSYTHSADLKAVLDQTDFNIR